MASLMTMQEIISDDWNDVDHVAYVRVEGTNYYKVIRWG